MNAQLAVALYVIAHGIFYGALFYFITVFLTEVINLLMGHDD